MKNSNAENGPINWNLVIKPTSAWFDLKLREIWRYRELAAMFVRRDFVTVYKQTILGPLWFLIQPLLSTTIFTIIFGKIARIPTNEIPHYLFYLSGLTFWGYFSECIINTSNTFVSNSGIFGKVYFPRMLVPISVVISTMIKFGVQLLLFTGFFIYYAGEGMLFRPNWYLLLFPLLVLQTALLALGLGLLISSLTTKYRDFTMLVGFGVSLWMYATPIVYPISQVPEKYLVFYRLNPMVSVICNFRYSVFGTGAPESLLFGWVLTIFFLIIGAISFTKIEKNFMDTV